MGVVAALVFSAPGAKCDGAKNSQDMRNKDDVAQRLQVAVWCIHSPQSYDMVTTVRPMYVLYSEMEPLSRGSCEVSQ